MQKRLSLILSAALLLTTAFAQGTSSTGTTKTGSPATSTGTSSTSTGTTGTSTGTSSTSSTGTKSMGTSTSSKGMGGMSMNMMAVNVNTATLAQLERIPGMTPRLAQAVIAARAKGPFKNEADFVKRVKGIGTHNIKKFEKYLKFA